MARIREQSKALRWGGVEWRCVDGQTRRPPTQTAGYGHLAVHKSNWTSSGSTVEISSHHPEAHGPPWLLSSASNGAPPLVRSAAPPPHSPLTSESPPPPYTLVGFRNSFISPERKLGKLFSLMTREDTGHVTLGFQVIHATARAPKCKDRSIPLMTRPKSV